MRFHPLALALWVALSAAAQPSATADAPDAGAAPELDRITVSATLSAREVADVPTAATVIERERMDQALVRDIRDLVRYEPGVSVTSSFGRFGLGGFRIRGLDGNRVRIEVDGAPVPEAFAIGSFSNAGRDAVDTDLLKRVEILRGPGSALHGSDALGGVVVFTTKDPVDLLRADRDSHFGLKTGYDSSDNGLFASATSAFAGERWSGLAALSHRQGQEPENQGGNASDGSARTAPNPQDTRRLALLSKLVFAPDADQRFKLTLDAGETEVETDVRSSLGIATGFGQPVQVLALAGDDLQTRARLAFEHSHDALGAGWADAVRWQVYRQDSETTQDTFEDRTTLVGGHPSGVTRRERRFNFDQRAIGGEFIAFKGFDLGGVGHYLSYGIEFERQALKQKRDGRAVLPNGNVTNVISPDTFPVRDFPLSTTTEVGVFVQDEIALADGRLRLLPGLRIDRFELDPQTDPLFVSRNPGVPTTGLSETSVSPKFGAVWKLDDTWSLFGNYARGFRAPPHSDVNLGFTNLQFGYTALPNPDLRPETSDGLELGLRVEGESGWLSLSAFHNRYRDFIESLRSLGRDPQTGLLVFQSQNVGRATIAGVEFKGGLALGRIADALANWQLHAAASWQRGDDEVADQPLGSVDPASAVLGLRYERERFGSELVARLAERRDRLPPANGQPTFEAPGYAVLDWLVNVELAEGLRVNAGLFNLTDRKYFQAGALPLLAVSTANVDRYTAPGRTLAFSVHLDW